MYTVPWDKLFLLFTGKVWFNMAAPQGMGVSAAIQFLTVYHSMFVTRVSRSGRSVYNAMRQTFSPLHWQRANKHGCILRSSNSKKKSTSLEMNLQMKTLETSPHPLRFKANLCLCLGFHLSQFHHFSGFGITRKHTPFTFTLNQLVPYKRNPAEHKSVKIFLQNINQLKYSCCKL